MNPVLSKISPSKILKNPALFKCLDPNPSFNNSFLVLNLPFSSHVTKLLATFLEIPLHN